MNCLQCGRETSGGSYCCPGCEVAAENALRARDLLRGAAAEAREREETARQEKDAARQKRRKELGLKWWEQDEPWQRFIAGCIAGLVVFALFFGWLAPSRIDGILPRAYLALGIAVACGMGTSWAQRVYRIHLASFAGAFCCCFVLTFFIKFRTNEQDNNGAPAGPVAKITVITLEPEPIRIRRGESKSIPVKVARSPGFNEPVAVEMVNTNNSDMRFDKATPKPDRDLGFSMEFQMQGNEPSKEIQLTMTAMPLARLGERHIEVKSKHIPEVVKIKVMIETALTIITPEPEPTIYSGETKEWRLTLVRHPDFKMPLTFQIVAEDTGSLQIDRPAGWMEMKEEESRKEIVVQCTAPAFARKGSHFIRFKTNQVSEWLGFSVLVKN